MCAAPHHTTSRWRNALGSVALHLADSLLSRACPGCARPFEAGKCPGGWCEPCLCAIENKAPRCQRCALEGWWAGPCDNCAANPPPFERAIVWGRYAPPLDRIIRTFKFRRDPALGRAFAAALAPRLSAMLAGRPAGAAAPIVVPIPLSVERLAERGYNQSLLIARPLAQACGLQLAHRALRRERAGPAQSGLAPAARHRNVEQVFHAPHPIHEPVVLVDDVMTTGATLAAASRVLLAAGAPSVICMAIARPPPPDASRRPGSP